NLASALYPPQAHRLQAVNRLVPLAVPRAATALVALAGLALLFLARGVRRGHRLAWMVAVGLLEGSALLHVVKGVDLEEAVVAIDTVPLSHRTDLFLRPALAAIGFGLAGFAVWLALRPVVLHRLQGADTGLEKAREVVGRYGQGTLDYFALRSDKQFFFDGES